MAGIVPPGIELEDGTGRWLDETGYLVVLEGYDSVPDFPTVVRWELEEANGTGLVLDEDGVSHVLIEGITPPMAATLGGYNDTVKFPVAFSKGARGSPTARTFVQEDAMGNVVRNSVWSKNPIVVDAAAGLRAAISDSADPKTEISRFVDFVRARRGAREAFRLQDPLDWSTAPSGVEKPDPTNKTHRVMIGHWVNNGLGPAAYQLFKEYRVGWITRRRAITHPMLPGDPLRVMAVYVDGVAITEGVDYTVTHNGGFISIISGRETTKTHGATVEVAFTFDVRARFGIDLDETAGVILEKTLAHTIPSIPIVEVNEPTWCSDHPYLGGAKEVALNTSQPALWLEPDQAMVWKVTPPAAGHTLFLPSKQGLMDGVGHLVLFNGAAGGSGRSLTIMDPDENTTVMVLAAGAAARFHLWSENAVNTPGVWKAD